MIFIKIFNSREFPKKFKGYIEIINTDFYGLTFYPFNDSTLFVKEKTGMFHPQIAIFLRAVNLGSFNKAAKALRRSPAAVMNQINGLEDRLGVKLLERGSGGVSLTEAGKIFYEDVKKIGDLAEQSLLKAKAATARARPRIRFGTSILRPCEPLLDYLGKFGQSWREKYRIEIVSFDDGREGFGEAREKLGERFDCFVSPCDGANWLRDFNIFYLDERACAVTLPVAHRLAAKKKLKLSDFYGEKLALVAKGLSPLIDRLREDILTNHPKIKIHDYPDFYDMEVFNKCAGGEFLLENPYVWAHPALATLPVDWDYTMRVGVVYAKNPSPAFATFMEELKATRGG